MQLPQPEGKQGHALGRDGLILFPAQIEIPVIRDVRQKLVVFCERLRPDRDVPAGQQIDDQDRGGAPRDVAHALKPSFVRQLVLQSLAENEQQQGHDQRHAYQQTCQDTEPAHVRRISIIALTNLPGSLDLPDTALEPEQHLAKDQDGSQRQI